MGKLRILLVVFLATWGCGGDDGSGDDDGGAPDAGGVECPAYQRYCDGACIPVSVDPNNCGGCGVTCTGDQACSAGACSDTCLPGQTKCDNACVDVQTSDQHCGGCDQPCADGTGCVEGHCEPDLITVDPPAACAGGGPPIIVGGADADCTAQTTFVWALCSCADLASSGPVLTDGYDSLTGPYVPGGLGGSVGLNDEYLSSSTADIWGALWASSPQGTNPSNDLAVHQELHVGGDFDPKTTTVGDDAFVNGDVSTTATITIDGTLHVPAGATISGNVTYGALVNEPVVVPQSCACDPADLIPVTDIVAARATDNDNATIGLDAGALTNPSAPQRVDLPCGHFYLDAITGSRAVTIVAHGHVALYIGGGVQVSAPVRFAVDPIGTLDVFIAGDFGGSNDLAVGSPNYPALSRFYIGSVNGFQISQNALLGAFFYAPYGLVHSSSTLEVFGGIFAGDYQSSSSTTIHYDRAVLEQGCEPPPDGCDSCEDCGNQACVGGQCGACTDSSQCCAPLVCVQGQCLPYVR